MVIVREAGNQRVGGVQGVCGRVGIYEFVVEVVVGGVVEEGLSESFPEGSSDAL